MSSEVKDVHKELATIMFEKGERFEKKHGYWIRLNLGKDSWLVMDSWNKAIHMVRGTCDYDNKFTGFTNKKKILYLGMDYGGFSSDLDVTLPTMKYYRESALGNNLYASLIGNMVVG